MQKQQAALIHDAKKEEKKYIDLDSFALDSVPQDLLELSTLLKLNMANNKITEIPETIYKLAELRVASFYNNKLEELPRGINQIPSLRRLVVR